MAAFNHLHIQVLTLTLSVFILPASAGQNPHQAYLALGDSVPFGYNPLIAPPDLNQYVGFPKIIAAVTGADLTNASCPYETTGTMLSPVAGQGCLFWMGSGGPLFVKYHKDSQMDFAVDFLKTNKKVQLVTIMIGGNDLANLLLGTCGGDLQCAQTHLPGVLATVGQNLATAFTQLRATGYTGPIVAVTYYGFNSNDAATTQAFMALNQVISGVATQAGGLVADGFTAFNSIANGFGGDACAAGLLIKQVGGNVEGQCNNHPSAFGQAVLAGAVAAAIGH